MRGGSNFYWIRVRSFVVVEFGVNPIWLLRVKLGAKRCGKPDRGARRAFSCGEELFGVSGPGRVAIQEALGGSRSEAASLPRLVAQQQLAQERPKLVAEPALVGNREAGLLPLDRLARRASFEALVEQELPVRAAQLEVSSM